MSECCKVKYQALDGKQFDTEKECRIHNELPRVWIVTNRTFLSADKAFVSKRDADHYMHKVKEEELYGYRYSVEQVILQTEMEITVNERITNSQVKPNWIQQLKGLIK